MRIYQSIVNIWLMTTVLFTQGFENPTKLEFKKTFPADKYGLEHANDKSGIIIQKFRFFENHQPASFARFFDLLEEKNPTIQSLFFNVLKSFPYDAYFWECPPVTSSNFNCRQFEFIIISSPILKSKSSDPSPFSKHIQQGLEKQLSVTSFQSLGGDATLIVPSNKGKASISSFTHLGIFMKQMDIVTISDLWNKVAVDYKFAVNKSNHEKVWLSTSGLGVSWLHVRIDSVPKYYQWVPYKREKRQLDSL